MSEDLIALLSPFQHFIEKAILKKTSSFCQSSKLELACQYALTEGGKRFRPALVLMVAKALHSSNDVTDAALAVEYFHTASLIADDLPCMDDDKERRGKPSTHIVYGESVALLASYALIADGYQLLADNTVILEKNGVENASKIGMLAIENVSYNTGTLGAAGGQYLDLFPSTIDEVTYRETVLKKTVALFEISFVLGWLFGGGDLSQLPEVKKTAYHYGMAFQIADDFDDFKDDHKNKRLMNAVSLFGFEGALKMFHEELKNYLASIETLKINSKELSALAKHLEKALRDNIPK